MAREEATRDRIVAAARVMVRDHGVDGVSMRKVAAEVGLAPTAIYWHVGDRSELLGAVLDSLLADLPPIAASGGTSRERIASVVRAARREFLEEMAVLRLANAVGRGSEVSFRAQVALAGELQGAGLDAEEAALAVRSLLFLAAGFVLIEDEYRQRDPAEVGTAHLWAGLDEGGVGEALRLAMAGPPDTDALFDYTLERLLASLVPDDDAR